MPAAVGPDFLCIGMLRTGTAWLFDQLQFHPDFWMPPIKEMQYLNRRNKIGRNAGDMLRATPQPPRRPKMNQAARRPWDERDIEFLTEMASHDGKPLDVQRYASLFRQKRNLKSGDVSPQYGSLSGDVIKDVARHLPDTRALLLVRDPVARAWSHICFLNRRGRVDGALFRDPAEFREYLSNSQKLRRLSFPSEIIRCWREHAPALSTRFFFFDDIAERPEDARREILVFLGADPAKPSGDLTSDHNKKSKLKKPELADDIKAVLVEYFAQELRDCAVLFGGHAKNWAAKYGV